MLSGRGSECTLVRAATTILRIVPMWIIRASYHLFSIWKVGRFYIQLASERDRRHVLSMIRGLLKPGQLLFVGVTDPSNSRVESPEEVRDRVVEAAELIPIEQLGTTDDCGFSPFADDTSTSRETAFAKVKSRVKGTEPAAKVLRV